MNDVAAAIAKDKPKGADLLLNFLHGLQAGMDSHSLLEALLKGEAIPAPPKKKRGRETKQTQPA